MGRLIKLVCVTAENNNKYYFMQDNDNGTFTVKYGRVKGTENTISYPIREWDKTYRAKTKKGYQDVTHLFKENGATATDMIAGKRSIIQIANSAVKSFFDKIQAYANKSVEENYTVSKEDVTQEQVDYAQSIVNELSSNVLKSTKDEVNSTLLKLYTIIPRRMKHVSEHLLESLSSENDRKKLMKMIDEEQKLLDTMAGQVEMLRKQKLAESGETEIEKEEVIDTLKMLGLEIAEATSEEIKTIKNLMGPNSSQFVKAFAVKNIKTYKRFEDYVSMSKNKKTELLWHGSRNENWLNILQTGLLIRPSGAVYTGSMFGDGVYGADKAKKSIGYTSLSGSYWAKGSSRTAYLALFQFHVGNQKIVSRSDYSLNKKKINSEGYDSVFAKGGADLINNEYIVYDISQTTIRYIVEISN